MDRSHSFELGVLDFCNLLPGTLPHEPIDQMLELASHAEALGYARYWVAEHHVPLVAHSSPEILVPLIAGMTREIRVGTGGVLLRYHNPLKLAKAFQLLELLFPDRIDLGIARGNAGEQASALLLEGRTEEIPYETKLHELLELMRGDLRSMVMPTGVVPPEIWTLGTHRTSMQLAAREGTAFCLALFLERPEPTSSAIVEEYRETFQANPACPAPRWSIAVAGVCAETEDKARSLVSTHFPKVQPTAVGTPAQCRAVFEELRAYYGTHEFIILDLCERLEDRMTSYELFAQALDIPPRQLDDADAD